MSKTLAVVAIALLVVTTVGVWATFSVENERRNLELRQIDALHQAASDGERFAAWRHATRYETFWIHLDTSPQKPKRRVSSYDRSWFIKSFQKSDVKSVGRSQRYGNSMHLVNTVIAIQDIASLGLLEFTIRRGAPKGVLDVLNNG